MDANAGLVSIGGYLPGKKISPQLQKRLVLFLKSDTRLPPEYIDMISADGVLRGGRELHCYFAESAATSHPKYSIVFVKRLFIQYPKGNLWKT